MATNENAILKARIGKIRHLCDEEQGLTQYFEAASLAQTVLHDTVGGAHPLMATLQNALESAGWSRAVAASRGVVTLFDEGGLTSPRLEIAHEIEGDILDIAQSQAQAAEIAKDPAQRQVHLAISAFLAGASLEDALRRLCDARGIAYDAQRTSISKLQAALFQPSRQIEIISSSENKHITAWGDTRNKADHGKFSEITYTEALTMVLGVRAFIDRHLP
jgi:hypothetical protein